MQVAWHLSRTCTLCSTVCCHSSGRLPQLLSTADALVVSACGRHYVSLLALAVHVTASSFHFPSILEIHSVNLTES